MNIQFKNLMCQISFFLLLALDQSHSLQAKVLIMTHSFNRPDFIEIQDKTFKSFLLDDYEFVVFNDAKNEAKRQEITNTCARLGLRCIRIPPEIHNKPYLFRLPYEDKQHACVRCANVVQYSLDVLGFDQDDLVVIFDSDMFLIQPFSFRQFLNGFDIAAVPQCRGHVEYIWNGLVILNMQTLPNVRSMNFNCGSIDGQGCDVGGYTYYYFKENPQVRLFRFSPFHISHLDRINDRDRIPPKVFSFIEKQPNNIEFLADFHILHYRGGGNWNQRSEIYHLLKTHLINDFINEMIQDYVSK